MSYKLSIKDEYYLETTVSELYTVSRLREAGNSMSIREIRGLFYKNLYRRRFKVCEWIVTCYHRRYEFEDEAFHLKIMPHCNRMPEDITPEIAKQARKTLTHDRETIEQRLEYDPGLKLLTAPKLFH